MKNWLVTIRTSVGVYYFTIAALTRNEVTNTARRLRYLLQGKDPRTYDKITLGIEEI